MKEKSDLKHKKSAENTIKKVSLQEEKSRELFLSVSKDADEIKDFYDKLAVADDPGIYKKEVGEKLRSLRRTSENLRRAYRSTVTVSDELYARWRDINRSKKKKKIIPAPPANAEIDVAEKRLGHFAQGMNLYKILYNHHSKFLYPIQIL